CVVPGGAGSVKITICVRCRTVALANGSSAVVSQAALPWKPEKDVEVMLATLKEKTIPGSGDVSLAGSATDMMANGLKLPGLPGVGVRPIRQSEIGGSPADGVQTPPGTYPGTPITASEGPVPKPSMPAAMEAINATR